MERGRLAKKTSDFQKEELMNHFRKYSRDIGLSQEAIDGLWNTLGKDLTLNDLFVLTDKILNPKQRERPKQMKPTYRSRPIKRMRRTKEDILQLRGALYSILSNDHPQTVRGVFYQAVSQGLIDKTEAEYKNVVIRLLTEMRRDGGLPYGWLADNTRWMRKPRTYTGLEDLLTESHKFYRRSLWHDQPVYIEVWMEKEALAGVIYKATAMWDVPLMITRGYPSLSFLHDAGEIIEETGKQTYIYYFGDYDPSGVNISKNVEEGLREFAPYTDIHFERVAVTPAQIQAWNLPTRPTKKSDTRAKTFEGESVELDAIPASELREMVNGYILEHIDEETIERLEVAEEAERKSLETIIINLQRQ